MKNHYQVCSTCCHKLNLEFNDFITSRCHRKYCDVCGYSSDNDLARLSKKSVDIAISAFDLNQKLPLFGKETDQP